MKKLSVILASILFGLISLVAFSGCDLLFGKSIVGTYKFSAVIRMGIASREVVDGELKTTYEERERFQAGDLLSENSEEVYTENTYVLDLKEDNTFLMVQPGQWSFFSGTAIGTWKKNKNEITLTTTQGFIVFYQDEKEKDVLCFDTYATEAILGEYSILQLKKVADPIEKEELKSAAGTYKFASLTSEYGTESITVQVGETDGNGETITPEYFVLDLRADGTCLAVGHRQLGLVDGKFGAWERTENGYRIADIFPLLIDFTVEGDMLKISVNEDGENITLTLSK